MDIKGFTAYLEGRGLAKRTKEGYLLTTKSFFDWIGKEDIQVTKPDILNYLEYLKSKGLQNTSRQNHLLVLSHYFTFLYRNEKISENPCLFLKIRGTKTKKLYKIYTPEELDQLFDNYYQLFIQNYDDSHISSKLQRRYSALYREQYVLMFSIFINQGVATSEIEKIEISDLDFAKATIRIRSGKRGKERVLPLKATQIGLFMNYLQNIRPQVLEYQTKECNNLFLSLPATNKKQLINDMSKNVFFRLATQIKTIDKQFLNFTQIRISLITFWIKTQGLRKAQYMAGHRFINSTEKFLPNNLDNLIDDINKLHPFL